MHLRGSAQVQHAKALLLSRPFLTRIPDQTLIASEAGEGTQHIQATRDSAGSYALVYIPSGAILGPREIELDLTSLAGEQVVAWWYDPRTGASRRVGAMPRQARMTFTVPYGGPDWVLVLDDDAAGYGRPGQSR
jgi:hypothetical protein